MHSPASSPHTTPTPNQDDPKLFANMVLKGKMPGPMDIARGKIKTNDPSALQNLMTCFKQA